MFTVDTFKMDNSSNTLKEANAFSENFFLEKAEELLGLSAPLLAYVERSDRMSLLDNAALV